MFDFKKEFPECYQDCFSNPRLLKGYLKDPDFVHNVEKLLYNSQTYYFREDPDLVGEFLLEYRETFLRALGRFEQREISLESYIGFTLKTYRKNFHKIKSMEKAKDIMRYSQYNTPGLNKQSVSDYYQRRSFPAGDCVAEAEDLSYADPKVSYSSHLPRDISRGVSQQINDIMTALHQRFQGTIKGTDKYKVLRLLLIYNQEFLADKELGSLLPRARWSRKQYDAIINQREPALRQIRIRKNEIERRLDRCYSYYVGMQQKQQQDEEQQDAPGDTKPEAHEQKLTRLNYTLNSLRIRYVSIRSLPPQEQISELTQISVTELRRYQRYLKEIARNFDAA